MITWKINTSSGPFFGVHYIFQTKKQKTNFEQKNSLVKENSTHFVYNNNSNNQTAPFSQTQINTTSFTQKPLQPAFTPQPIQNTSFQSNNIYATNFNQQPYTNTQPASMIQPTQNTGFQLNNPYATNFNQPPYTNTQPASMIQPTQNTGFQLKNPYATNFNQPLYTNTQPTSMIQPTQNTGFQLNNPYATNFNQQLYTNTQPASMIQPSQNTGFQLNNPYATNFNQPPYNNIQPASTIAQQNNNFNTTINNNLNNNFNNNNSINTNNNNLNDNNNVNNNNIINEARKMMLLAKQDNAFHNKKNFLSSAFRFYQQLPDNTPEKKLGLAEIYYELAKNAPGMTISFDQFSDGKKISREVVSLLKDAITYNPNFIDAYRLLLEKFPDKQDSIYIKGKDKTKHLYLTKSSIANKIIELEKLNNQSINTNNISIPFTQTTTTTQSNNNNNYNMPYQTTTSTQITSSLQFNQNK